MIRLAKDTQTVVVAGMEWLAEVYTREPTEPDAPKPTT